MRKFHESEIQYCHVVAYARVVVALKNKFQFHSTKNATDLFYIPKRHVLC